MGRTKPAHPGTTIYATLQSTRGSPLPRVWSGGRWRHVGAVDRGALLVRSEREWRRRAWNRVLVNTMVMSVLMTVFAVLFQESILTPEVLVSAGPAWNAAMLMLIMLGLIALSALVCGAGRMAMGRAVPGVYERGVELPWGLFVPYEEVLRVEPVGMRTALVLRPAGPTHHLDAGIFGREGASYVAGAVAARAATGGVGAPPRLVVYGGER
jgi:hypothetical protein